MEQIREKGIQTAEVTLHVGAGTFKPVKADIIADHEMHTEFISVRRETVEKLLKNDGKLIVVGTTSLRTVESLYYIGRKLYFNPEASLQELTVGQWEPYDNPDDISPRQALQSIISYLDRHRQDRLMTATQIIIVPGYHFHYADAIITNFHQPQSTLLLLIAAFVGDDWEKIYDYALHNNYRFLSYGDSSLLWKRPNNLIFWLKALQSQCLSSFFCNIVSLKSLLFTNLISIDLFAKIVRVFAIIIGSIILLNLILLMIFSIPAVQKGAADIALEKFKPVIGTEVTLDGIRFRLFNTVGLSGLCVEDQQQDTLAYIGKLAVRIHPMDLFRNKVTMEKVSLENFMFDVHRPSPNDPFNFQFLIDAFAKEKDTTVVKKGEKTLAHHSQRCGVEERTAAIQHPFRSANTRSF